MRKYRLLLLLSVILGMISCENTYVEKESLKSQLNHPDSMERCIAAMEVGRQTQTEYIGKLKEMLSDPSGRVQYCAAWSLTKLNQKEGVTKLLDIVQSIEYMEDLEEGFDYDLLAKSLKVKADHSTNWNQLIAKHPEWKTKFKK